MKKLYGYAGKILRINLTEQKITFDDAEKYVKDFIGGRGVVAKIAWDELKPGVDPFSPENKLIIMTGPLTGILSPGSGRTAIGGIAPQVYPKPWFTRSNIGGRFGSELKYCGFDGIVIEGTSDKPVYVWIHDEREVELLDASNLWGLDTFAAQKELSKKHGGESASLCIGPAGENLVRIATINSGSGNAAGQGGFGAVMGSKKLKAIVVTSKRNAREKDGAGVLEVADPKRLMELWMKTMKLIQGGRAIPEQMLLKSYDGREIKYPRKFHACTHACPGLCVRGRFIWSSFMWKDAPSKAFHVTESGHTHCIGPSFMGFQTEAAAPVKVSYELDIADGLVIKNLCDKLGINQWDFIGGVILSILICHRKGMIDESKLEGLTCPIDPNDPYFWVKLLEMIAYRKGIGDILAEGLVRAADKLGISHEEIPYVTCGFAEHGAGRGVWGFLEYPYWIVGALLWATDSRDPFSDTGHTYPRLVYGLHYVAPLKPEQLKAIARKLWESEESISDDYQGKVQPVIWMQNRGCLTSSLPTDDYTFPIVASNFTEDGFGDTSLESQLYSAVTGVEYTEEQLDMIGERIFNLERAIAVREGRTRQIDENVIPFFKRPNWTRRITLDEKKFKELLDEYYEARGWDIKTGWPTKSKLEELGLGDVAKELYKE